MGATGVSPVRTTSGKRDAVSDAEENLKAILSSPSYTLAEQDTKFLARRELRPVRLQLELLKPEMALAEYNINTTIVVFGATTIRERSQGAKRLEIARAALAAPGSGTKPKTEHRSWAPHPASVSVVLAMCACVTRSSSAGSDRRSHP